MQHATKTSFGTEHAMCNEARKFLVAREIGSGGSGFSVRWFTTNEVTCVDCLAILTARSPFAIPTPEIAPGPPPRDTNLRRQIRASMLKRYGPSIEDPEWATEGFVPR